MSFFSSAAKLWHATNETHDAFTAASEVLKNGGSPVAALRAAAAKSDNQLDDAAVVELELGIRHVIGWLGLGTRAAVWAADTLADPRVRQGLDAAIGAVIDAGYQLGRARHTLKRWAEE